MPVSIYVAKGPFSPPALTHKQMKCHISACFIFQKVILHLAVQFKMGDSGETSHFQILCQIEPLSPPT